MFHLKLTFDLLKGSSYVVSTVVTIDDSELHRLLSMMTRSINAYGVRFKDSSLVDYVPDVISSKMALAVFEAALNLNSSASVLCDFVEVSEGVTLMMCGNVNII